MTVGWTISIRRDFARAALDAAFALTIAAGEARASGLVVFGYKDEGGGIDAFEKVIDLSTGSERIIEMRGRRPPSADSTVDTGAASMAP